MRKPIGRVTVVSRPKCSANVDQFVTISGDDKPYPLLHAIGFWKGAAVVERLEDESIVKLTESERDYYNNVIYKHINNTQENK